MTDTGEEDARRDAASRILHAQRRRDPPAPGPGGSPAPKARRPRRAVLPFLARLCVAIGAGLLVWLAVLIWSAQSAG